MYAVILAGGGGTRLWPLSRPDRPKPFLPLLGDESLLQRTVRRLDGLVAPEDVFVVTERRHARLVTELLPDATVVEEPAGRNTAAAIALAALAIDRPEREVMVVLPADHLIVDEASFRAVLRAAEKAAHGQAGQIEPLVTLGVEPDRPATEYGYIRFGASLATIDDAEVFRVDRFIEKPTTERAQDLLAREAIVAWNAGIFVWRRRSILASLERHAPQILDAVGSGLAERRLDEAYEAFRPISIDYAVMEPASTDGLVQVIPMSVGWSDLGSWPALVDALPGMSQSIDGGRVAVPGETIALGRDDLLVHSVGHRLVITGGPQTGIVLDGHGAVLVGARHRAADVEALLERCAVKETERL